MHLKIKLMINFKSVCYAMSFVFWYAKSSKCPSKCGPMILAEQPKKLKPLLWDQEEVTVRAQDLWMVGPSDGLSMTSWCNGACCGSMISIYWQLFLPAGGLGRLDRAHALMHLVTCNLVCGQCSVEDNIDPPRSQIWKGRGLVQRVMAEKVWGQLER